MRRISRLITALSLVSLCAWVTPGATLAQSADCESIDLAVVRDHLDAAEEASAIGDRAMLAASLLSARDAVIELAEACPAPVASLAPVELGVLLPLDTFTLRHPDTLEVLEEDLLRSTERGGGAEAVTLGDSQATGELISRSLEAPMPPTAAALGIAFGSPAAVLAAVGSSDPDDPAPGSPEAALEALAAAIAEATANASSQVTSTAVESLVLPDGTRVAVLPIEFVGEDADLRAVGRFLVRDLGDGRWALAVAVAAPGSFDALADQALAVLASIQPI